MAQHTDNKFEANFGTYNTLSNVNEVPFDVDSFTSPRPVADILELFAMVIVVLNGSILTNRLLLLHICCEAPLSSIHLSLYL